MRLLQLQRDGKFSLVERVGEDIPQYAILSHTWGKDDEEVTFKDLSEDIGSTKAGYKKLTFCGKQAVKDELQYFWVDTCCIDKSSSAELAEAINSMFQWYYKAEKCYVYLSDVDVAKKDLSFQKSRWFTRGWTLQELVAPRSVEFFTSEGERIGDKLSMIQDICQITGIPVDALRGVTPLTKFSADERMSWAENRETKREEDAAYSLLGIFGISLPLIYGEGKERAFFRLRKEIRESRNHAHYSTPEPERFCITAISRKEGLLDVFVCGPDGKVYTWWEHGKGWANLPTTIKGDFPPGAKVTVVSRDAKKLDLFACDIDGRICTAWWHIPDNPFGILGWSLWSGWYVVGNHLPSGTKVAAVSRREKLLDLFAQTENGQIHMWQWTEQDRWPKDHQGLPLPRNSQGFPDEAHITVAASDEDHMNLFACDRDGSIRVAMWNSDAGWTDWKSIGRGFSAQTEVTAIVQDQNTLELFACQPDGQVCTTAWEVGSDSIPTWNKLSCGAKFAAQSKVVATKLSSETTELFVHGRDDLIYTCWCSETPTKWAKWEAIQLKRFLGSVDVVAVVRVGSKSVDLLVSHSDDQGLTVWWTRGSKHKWRRWQELQVPENFRYHA